jgi:soluble lytic murein transglycosylase-like protein
MEIVRELAAVAARIAEIANFAPEAPREFDRLVRAGNQPGRGAFSPAAPPSLNALIASSAAAYQVDPSLVTAIVANESGFSASAVSSAGAQGLMQLMPQTAAGLGVADPFDPAQNIRGGTRYLRGLLDRFGGDIERAVAAYNAGPGAVEKYGGVPPYVQTYVRNVLASYEKYRAQNRR